MEDWKHIIWSDETKINCIGPDDRKWAWKMAEEGLSDRLIVMVVDHPLSFSPSFTVEQFISYAFPDIAVDIDLSSP